MTTPDPHLLADLVAASRTVGDPARDWALLAEGNTSVRDGADTMIVKATGAHLATATEDDFVAVDLAAFRALLDRGEGTDDDVTIMFERSRVWGTKRPSVESILHAVCYDIPEVTAVVHCHATPVLTLMASDQADAVLTPPLFPDQIVVLGRTPLLMPYIDPGLPLAVATRTAVREYIATQGTAPRVIYLQNHGLFALGKSLDDAIGITAMAVKVARILLGALAIGSPVPLSEAHADRIDTRPDELLRRRMLSQT